MRGFEQIPWLYDAFMALADRGRLGRWRKWLVGGATGRTLEVGCGTGLNLPLYRGASLLVGVDPWLASLRAAQRRAPGLILVQARAEALPFRPDAFDTVVSSLVFCSVADPPAALAETQRVLAPGGTLRMMEHVRAHRPGLAWLQDLLQPVWTWLTGGCHPNRSTEETVQLAGFTIDPASHRSSGVMRRFAATAASPERSSRS